MVGVLSAGVGYGVGVYDGVSALAGGVSVGLALVLTGLAVLPWRAREAREWMGWLFAAQMGTLAISVVYCLVAWRALGAEVGALGFTGAGAFVLGQMTQTMAFASADRAARGGVDGGSEGGSG
ncbi:MAG: hypothetical protein Tsb0013_24660 [Phycisphaerales bacterium]